MKIAIYTLTRDRLAYTQHCFQMLKMMAGHPYDHFVIDNASTDGTVKWLNQQYDAGDLKALYFNQKNYGNCVGNNQAMSLIVPDRYDLIIRMDNDCEVVTKNLLVEIVGLYQALQTARMMDRFIISPRVTGIVNQPPRIGSLKVQQWALGIVNAVGGLFRVIPASVLKRYEWPTTMSVVAGEEIVSAWHREQGGLVAYAEDLIVNHYETTSGQERRYPEYHKRKLAEWQNHPDMDYVMPMRERWND